MLENPCSNIGYIRTINAMSPADNSFVNVSLKYFLTTKNAAAVIIRLALGNIATPDLI